MYFLRTHYIGIFLTKNMFLGHRMKIVTKSSFANCICRGPTSKRRCRSFRTNNRIDIYWPINRLYVVRYAKVRPIFFMRFSTPQFAIIGACLCKLRKYNVLTPQFPNPDTKCGNVMWTGLD